MNRQIPLELPVTSAQARDDLIVSPSNAFAVDFLDSWPNWPGPVAVLIGPAGSGKTHMAGVWAAVADAETMSAEKLDASRPLPADSQNIVVEDAGAAPFDEAALFHLINHVRAAGGHCLITSRLPPADWQVRLPDLASRLRAAHRVELAEPDDELLRLVMVKLFADRQVTIDPVVLAYVIPRMERSLEAAGRLVAEMDREALSRNRRVNRAIAAAALEKMT